MYNCAPSHGLYSICKYYGYIYIYIIWLLPKRLITCNKAYRLLQGSFRGVFWCIIGLLHMGSILYVYIMDTFIYTYIYIHFYIYMYICTCIYMYHGVFQIRLAVLFSYGQIWAFIVSHVSIWPFPLVINVNKKRSMAQVVLCCPRSSLVAPDRPGPFHGLMSSLTDLSMSSLIRHKQRREMASVIYIYNADRYSHM